MDKKDLTLVSIPPEMEHIIGAREGQAHIHTREGAEEEAGRWFEALLEIVGPCVGTGAVALFVPVSRAAIYKRINDGKLSLFRFKAVSRRNSLFRRERFERESPFSFVPVSECKAWRAELDDRAVRYEQIGRDELEKAKPNWENAFMQWDSRLRGEQVKTSGIRNKAVTLMLSDREKEVLDDVASKLKSYFASKEEFLAYWVSFTAAQGLSGLSFLRLGCRIERLYDYAGIKEHRPATKTRRQK